MVEPPPTLWNVSGGSHWWKRGGGGGGGRETDGHANVTIPQTANITSKSRVPTPQTEQNV